MELTRKSPRDFVFIDELWPADKDWPSVYPGNKVWVFMDEYWATLPGDQDYRRLIISGGEGEGWIFKRRLNKKVEVSEILLSIQTPIREKQLRALGFRRWRQLDEM